MNSESPPLVLYDAECPACVSLAQFAAKRTTDAEYLSWQAFQNSPTAQKSLPEGIRKQRADHLRVWTGTDLLEGPAAWTFLLEKNRDLAGLGWLAGQLGLQSVVAKSMNTAGKVVRNLCLRCPRGRGR